MSIHFKYSTLFLGLIKVISSTFTVVVILGYTDFALRITKYESDIKLDRKYLSENGLQFKQFPILLQSKYCKKKCIIS